jgi:hypothetical protein
MRVTICTDTAHLLDAPRNNATVVGRLHQDDAIMAIERDGQWIHLRASNGEGWTHEANICERGTVTTVEQPQRPQRQATQPRRARASVSDEFRNTVAYGEVKDMCERQWPGDYQMQEYCIRKQGEAYYILQSTPQDVSFSIFEGIRAGCKREWGGDYQMREYCERKQVEAYRAIQ